jgi:hypothetical protein
LSSPVRVHARDHDPDPENDRDHDTDREPDTDRDPSDREPSDRERRARLAGTGAGTMTRWFTGTSGPRRES